MKTIIIIASSLIASLAIAQPKYNSMYSTSNYKMPNLAKVAKENNLDKSQSFVHKDAITAGQNNSSNYKNSFAKSEGNGGVLPILPIEIVVTPLTSAANYKSNFKGVKKASKSEVAPVQQPLVTNPSKSDEIPE